MHFPVVPAAHASEHIYPKLWDVPLVAATSKIFQTRSKLMHKPAAACLQQCNELSSSSSDLDTAGIGIPAAEEDLSMDRGLFQAYADENQGKLACASEYTQQPQRTPLVCTPSSS